MQSMALISFLFAFPFTRAVAEPICSFQALIKDGQECKEAGENSEWCDYGCTNKFVCKDGTMQFVEACGLNHCSWNSRARKAACLPWEPETAQPLTLGVSRIVADPDTEYQAASLDYPESPTPREVVVSSESNRGCSATFSIGANCGFDPALEGAMSCDTTCNNVGICHNGVFQVNSPCSPGHCQWRGDIGQPFCV